MGLVEMRAFHSGIRNRWVPWVRDAPASWKADGFLLNHVPISVACRYGQNRKIAVPNSEAAEFEVWDKERNYSRIRHVSMALATHIS